METIHVLYNNLITLFEILDRFWVFNYEEESILVPSCLPIYGSLHSLIYTFFDHLSRLPLMVLDLGKSHVGIVAISCTFHLYDPKSISRLCRWAKIR